MASIYTSGEVVMRVSRMSVVQECKKKKILNNSKCIDYYQGRNKLKKVRITRSKPRKKKKICYPEPASLLTNFNLLLHVIFINYLRTTSSTAGNEKKDGT